MLKSGFLSTWHANVCPKILACLQISLLSNSLHPVGLFALGDKDSVAKRLTNHRPTDRSDP